MSNNDGETVISSFDHSLISDKNQGTAALIVLNGPDIGRRYLLNEDMLILGRSPLNANLVIQDPAISSRHSMIQYSKDVNQYTITDLQSRNGMVINTSKTDFAVLTEGDKIFLGATIFKFTFMDALEKSYHEEIDEMINVDSLTGLPAKRIFDCLFKEKFAAAQEGKQPFCALMMDMDGLKKINDSMGHQMGSHCIAEVGKLINRLISPKGMATRFGGDEFIAYLEGTAMSETLVTAESIRQAVESHSFQCGDAQAAPTISIGIAGRTSDIHNSEELIRQADEALYRAKRGGRNQVSK